jgi:hypothetical protein
MGDLSVKLLFKEKILFKNSKILTDHRVPKKNKAVTY